VSNTALVATSSDTRLPRGALAVVAVGLLATVAAALLSTDDPVGAAELNWDAKRPLPDSRTASIPGGGAMQIEDAGIRVSAPNAAGYRIYRVAAVLAIDAGSAVGQARVRCETTVPSGVEVAQTPEYRASYPRSSEELVKQELPERTLVEFASHGTELATLGLDDAFAGFANRRGIVVEWLPYRVGREGWQWGLPPDEPLDLGFATYWRTTGPIRARVICGIETAGGQASVETGGGMAASP
jgi:hypothetical protein